MKGEVRHERATRQWRRRGGPLSDHRYHVSLTIKEQDVNLLRRLGNGSLNDGMRQLMDTYTALTQ